MSNITEKQFAEMVAKMPPEQRAKAREQLRQKPADTPAARKLRSATLSATSDFGVQVGACAVAAISEHYVTECAFHPTRKWRLDFAWPHRMIAAEIHGSIHRLPGSKQCPQCGEFPKGRHSRMDGFEGDREKINAALLLGWRVFEFSTRQVRSGAALSTLKDAFEVLK